MIYSVRYVDQKKYVTYFIEIDKKTRWGEL